MRTNVWTVFALTGTIATLADGWSLLLCAIFGVVVAILAFHDFIFQNLKSAIVILILGIVGQFFLLHFFGVTFLIERIGYMLTPISYIYVFKLILRSKARIYIEDKARMIFA